MLLPLVTCAFCQPRLHSRSPSSNAAKKTHRDSATSPTNSFYSVYHFCFKKSDESIDESFFKAKTLDVITSKVRRNRDYCVGQVFLSVVYMLTMNYSYIYLAELLSIQNRRNFATICARKGYQSRPRDSDMQGDHTHSTEKIFL